MLPKKPALKPGKDQNEFDMNKQSSSQQGQSMSSLPGPSLRDAVRKVSNAGIFRRQSKIVNPQDELAQQVMQKYGLERLDLERVNFNFKKFVTAENGKLQFHQLLGILKSKKFTVDESLKKLIFKELEDKGIKVIELETVFLIVGMLRQKEHKLMEEGDDDYQSEFIDAFVALGGNPDSTGKVMKTAMLKVIKDEFDLTFDIEKIMERIEASSEELDYHTFCMLFDTQNEEKNRRSSRASTILSV